MSDNGDEQPEVEPRVILTANQVKEGLSHMYRIADGSSFSWGTLTVEEKDPKVQELTDVNEKSETFKQCVLDSFP